MTEFITRKKLAKMPRLPLEGNLDLTYRCNNNCRHCWLWLPKNASDKAKELTLEEIEHIVNEARRMGCRRWAISGGEPMLRPDFSEIFEFITSHCHGYSLNTNGTLITSTIARLLKRKGSKMVALYGASADVHDRVTRNPGSFEAAMRGFAYLKEAGAGFTVQIIPMQENYHQLQAMEELARTLSPHYRIGAAWLYLSACHDSHKNQEIRAQRLPPRTVVELDEPDLSYEDSMNDAGDGHYAHAVGDDRLFAPCIDDRRDFHIDPYGLMSFCSFVKAPDLRYDLRQGNFQEAWDEFIPSLADKVRGGEEYLENCGACNNRDKCRWCPVYGYLEHGRFSAKVEYLCAVAEEIHNYKRDWMHNHRRYYGIADMTVKVESDLPLNDTTFQAKFEPFRLEEPGDDVISIRHHFSLPEIDKKGLGTEVYRRVPWAIYRQGGSWIYLGISPRAEEQRPHRVAVFDEDHTHARIYSPDDEAFRKGNLASLTMFPTDQILLARILADREGCFLHSSGVILDGKGLLFVGHSDAGKSTTVTMLKGQAEILCDDRNIVRKKDGGFRVYGTWSHGDVPDVSSASAPLHAILFLKQAADNRIVPVENNKESLQVLLACLIKPFVTTDWWDKTLTFIESLVKGVPCYHMYFDKSGKIIDSIRSL
jgi:MoaA/NifB/PqqE/SkfB family radical SAM enzyme